MRYALIVGAAIQTIVEQDSLPTIGGYWVLCPDSVGPGYTYDGSTWTAPNASPASISPRQFRQALTAIGLRSTVEAAIAAADQDIKDWYEYSTAIDRNNAVLNAMATALGKTGAETDALFQLAATL